MQLKHISSEEFQRSYSYDSTEWELVDVREPWEVSLLSLVRSKTWPFSQILEGQVINKDVDQNKKIAFICRSGGRSIQAAHLCYDQQALEVYNIKGGIEQLYRNKSDLLDIQGDAQDVKNYLS